METVTFNRDSWHYKFVSRFTPMKRNKQDWDNEQWRKGTEVPYLDICLYRSYFVLACLVFLLCAFTVASLAVSTGDFLAWAVVCLVYWVNFEPNITAIFAMTILAFTVMVFTSVVITGTIRFIYLWYVDRKGKSEEIPEPSFISRMYHSWKEKVCYKIEVE